TACRYRVHSTSPRRICFEDYVGCCRCREQISPPREFRRARSDRLESRTRQREWSPWMNREETTSCLLTSSRSLHTDLSKLLLQRCNQLKPLPEHVLKGAAIRARHAFDCSFLRIVKQLAEQRVFLFSDVEIHNGSPSSRGLPLCACAVRLRKMNHFGIHQVSVVVEPHSNGLIVGA